jgi:beta-galactosidase GanA
VQAYLALAHGAKGISYYLYRGPSDGAYQGLVDTSYQHTSPPYAEKWQAVHDVFAQLDSMGDTLLRLEREAAYCPER